MSFKIWKKWFKTRSIYFKWFIILVLFRPIIDIGNKKVVGEQILNVQEIAGIITYLLLVISIVNVSGKNHHSHLIEKWVKLFGTIIFVSFFVHFLLNPNYHSINLISKVLFSFILFIYLNRVITGINDVEGILFTALIATIIPAIIIVYEIIFGPIFFHISRGLTRFQGLYEDVFTYSFNLIIALIAFIYFYFKDSMSKKRRSTFLLYILFLFSILVTFKLNHNLTTVTVVLIIFYFISQKFKINPAITLASIIIFLTVSFYFFSDDFENEFMKSINTEISIVEGTTVIERGFHGRFYRWFNIFYTWDEYPVQAHIFGIPFTFGEYPSAMLSGMPHSDFIRILFTSGFIGLFVYVIIFPIVFRKTKGYSIPKKFLIRSSFFVLFLFSITSLPLLYAPLMYIIITILVLLKIEIRNEQLNKFNFAKNKNITNG